MVGWGIHSRTSASPDSSLEQSLAGSPASPNAVVDELIDDLIASFRLKDSGLAIARIEVNASVLRSALLAGALPSPAQRERLHNLATTLEVPKRRRATPDDASLRKRAEMEMAFERRTRSLALEALLACRDLTERELTNLANHLVSERAVPEPGPVLEALASHPALSPELLARWIIPADPESSGDRWAARRLRELFMGLSTARRNQEFRRVLRTVLDRTGQYRGILIHDEPAAEFHRLFAELCALNLPLAALLAEEDADALPHLTPSDLQPMLESDSNEMRERALLVLHRLRTPRASRGR